MSSSGWRRLLTPLLLTWCVLCACGAPVVLRGPSAWPAQVAGALPVKLSVQAVEPSGGPLTYAWKQLPESPAGTFSEPTSPSPTWLAPAVRETRTFTLRVTVTDASGDTTQAEVQVVVQPPARRKNRPPVLEEPVASSSLARAGDTLTLSVRAVDPDGDPLTYLWRQVGLAPRGTFASGQEGTSVTWYSPAVGTETAFTFEVLVSDAQGAQARRTVTVPVRVPRYEADIQVLWDSVCTRCHGRSGGLALTPDRSHEALVGVKALTRACGHLARVEPGNPDASALVLKLSGTSCGARMPRDRPGHFDTHPGELVRIRSWILGGAAKD